MSQNVGKNNNKVYKLVLTGGPCGGKTTGQTRLCTFFENLGWKVYRVPETATILMGGGVKWPELASDESYRFQENLIRTMVQIENTFFDLAESCQKNCLVICDRGCMDASAYLKPADWEKMKKLNHWNDVDLRDNRYNQVIHMVSAAKGAEAFYQTESHTVRHEGVTLARELDALTSQAWVGHPYYDVIDNSTHFERKVTRMIATVCDRLGLEVQDRLARDSRKRKFLVRSLPDDLSQAFPQYQDFLVVHDYLATPAGRMQARIRKRGPIDNPDKINWLDYSGNWTYTHTIRRPEVNEEAPEVRMQVSIREYELLLVQKDMSHFTIYKKRRCFLWNNQYFQLDIYQDPCPPGCRGLIIMETYTTNHSPDMELPSFLDIEKEVTSDPNYSMYNLSLRPDTARVSHQRSNSEGDDLGGLNSLRGRTMHLSGDSSLTVDKKRINKKYSYCYGMTEERDIDIDRFLAIESHESEDDGQCKLGTSLPTDAFSQHLTNGLTHQAMEVEDRWPGEDPTGVKFELESESNAMSAGDTA